MDEAVRALAPAEHAILPVGTWRWRWSVHCQPAGSGEPVVGYLARYVGRTSISGNASWRRTTSACRGPRERPSASRWCALARCRGRRELRRGAADERLLSCASAWLAPRPSCRPRELSPRTQKTPLAPRPQTETPSRRSQNRHSSRPRSPSAHVIRVDRFTCRPAAPNASPTQSA